MQLDIICVIYRVTKSEIWGLVSDIHVHSICTRMCYIMYSTCTEHSSEAGKVGEYLYLLNKYVHMLSYRVMELENVLDICITYSGVMQLER